jgi:putative transcriptional regulator
MDSLQGKLLVASPHLGDGNFYKSVVLMIKHDADGALGLILNRPTTTSVGEVMREIIEQDLECDQPVFVGGPVNGPMVVLHPIKSCSEADVVRGVYFTADKEKILKVVSQSKKPFRVFVGYAGWAGGQLEGEMHAGGWLSADATSDLVFYQGDDLWEQVIRTIGDEIIGTAIKVKHVPQDPTLN